MIDFTGFDALTFDCYGTLIDWERGILDAIAPVMSPYGIQATEEELLERYARHEAALEAGEYMAYREILGLSLRGLCEESGFTTSEEQEVQFAQAVGNWPAFGDSTAALRRLAKRYKLGVITNCDDDLFALSNERLGVSFDWIITAQKAGSYKPSLHNFEVAFATIGLPRHRILHVAQSLYHDHVPAKQIGMTTVWVNRRHGKEGRGATPAAAATPDLMVPDMKTFADIALERPPEGTRH